MQLHSNPKPQSPNLPTGPYPFGMVMQGRAFSIQSRYRYGFNGKELDADIGSDNYDFGARIYDSRIGRWMAVDPYYKYYLSVSPYNFVANNPIVLIDLDGNRIKVKGTKEQRDAYLKILNSSLKTYQLIYKGKELIIDANWTYTPIKWDPKSGESNPNLPSEFDKQMSDYLTNKKTVNTNLVKNTDFLFLQFNGRSQATGLILDDFLSLNGNSAGFARALISYYYATNLLESEEAKKNETAIINDEYVPKLNTSKKTEDKDGKVSKLIIINTLQQKPAENKITLTYSSSGESVTEVADDKIDPYTHKTIYGKKNVKIGYYYIYDYKGINVTITTDLMGKVNSAKVEATLIDGTKKEITK